MIYKIKALYDAGNGLSIHQIAEQLKLSRNTVRKYLRMKADEIPVYLHSAQREKVLDEHREYMRHLLEMYPELSSGKMLRKLKTHGLEVEISQRSVRRYMASLVKELPSIPGRRYEPVLDMVPGVQCQVDGGELRDVMIAGQSTTVYFLVFVLSYSRMMYVTVSLRPLNTDLFITMHDQAFRFFDGVVEECVYDQTKLVVIKEEFRELWLNQRFHQYANIAGFKVRVCEGYDPESKGKVEAGVKYVKKDFFYGDSFGQVEELRQRMVNWIKTVANVRVHGTTREVPWDVYDLRERPRMKPYLSPKCLQQVCLGETRQVDKTSLISWKSNKYSVPGQYQSSSVFVRQEEGWLLIHAPDSNQPIARHRISACKGEVLKNLNHYRSRQDQIIQYEQTPRSLLGDELALSLCQIIRQTTPEMYKDQLLGLKHVIGQYSSVSLLRPWLKDLAQRPELRVSYIRDYLAAAMNNPWSLSLEDHLFSRELKLYHGLDQKTLSKEDV
ncbi:IS21 family transposase [Deltaproteobacteria bacterium TL4]